MDLMSDAARKTVHELVDEVPDEKLPDVQQALEQVIDDASARVERDQRAVELINAHLDDDLRDDIADALTYQAEW